MLCEAHTSNSSLFSALCRICYVCIRPIENDCHLFECVAPGLRVEEEGGGTEADAKDHENEVVLPCDSHKSYRIDKSIEENSRDC